MSKLKTAYLVLDDGRIFEGSSWAKTGETYGEAVFSTGMTGYQEIYTDPSFISELNKLPDPVKQKWINEISVTDTVIDKSSLRYSKWVRAAVGKLHKKNVPFMAGTDTPIGYLIPGRSLHKELEVLVESGFSNLEAIKTATVNPATFLGLEGKVGRIKNGYKADLVILNSNP